MGNCISNAKGAADGEATGTQFARSNLFLDEEALATLEEIWQWEQKPWEGTAEKMRRTKTPSIYMDLANAAQQNSKSLKTEGSSQSSDSKIFSDAQFAISGKADHNKGHQIHKSPTCRPFYGPIAERAVGCHFGEEDQESGWRILLRGKGNVIGIEKMAENFVVLTDPHESIYDSLSKGVVTTIPIIQVEDALEWDQGIPYDLLLIADSKSTYESLAPRERRNVLQKATPEDVRTGTEFLSSCIAALVELLASDDNKFLGTMTDILKQKKDEDHDSKVQNYRAIMRKDKLPDLKCLRDKLRKEQGHALLPTTKPDVTKSIIKVNMEDYMKYSGVGTYGDDVYPFADPLLVGFKAAINAYYQITRPYKLLPACVPPADSSDEESSVDVWQLDESTDDGKGATYSPSLYVWVPTEIEIGGGIPVVSDEEVSLGELRQN